MNLVWLAIRIAFVAYWAHSGWKGLPVAAAFRLGVESVAFPLVFGALTTRYWIVRPYLAKDRKAPWLAPSWLANPFQLEQPFQFIHLCGVSFVVFALSALARGLQSGAGVASVSLPPELFAGGFGAGILIGIRWSMAAYRGRFI